MFTALLANGYVHVSSEVDQDPGPYPWNTTGLYHWPIQSQTSNQAETQGITAEETWAQIQRQITTYGFAGVMMHPPEFSQMDATGEVLDAVNQTQLNELTKLIQLVLNAGKKAFFTCYHLGLKLVTISSVEKNILRPTTGLITTASITTAPITTAPITTAPVTTALVTTSLITTAPMTTALITSSEITTAAVTTAEMTTSPITTISPNLMTTAVMEEVSTTSQRDFDQTSDANTIVLSVLLGFVFLMILFAGL